MKAKSSEQYTVCFSAIPGFPHVEPGDDIAQLLFEASNAAGLKISPGDIFVIAHKVISKAEGRSRKLNEIRPSDRAFEVANTTGKDPRLIELILRESDRISRMKQGLLIVRHRLGFTSANAGIDRSNVYQESDEETVLLLPEDPDKSANDIRTKLAELTGFDTGVVIADSHGRPFRLGTVGVAIGVSGLPALWDRRGEPDLFGYELQHTDVGTADEIAAAASLIMGQAAEGTPAVHISGLRLPDVQGRASDLVRSIENDLYL